MANYNSKWSGPEIDEFLGYAEKAVCYESQELTAEQKAQARDNIGALSEVSTDYAGKLPQIQTDGQLGDSGISGADAGKAVGMALATSAPYETVTLAPSEVNAYIQALPRLLTKDLWLYITAGTVSQTLDFSQLYGPGRLWLAAASGAEVQLAGGVKAYFARAEIVLQGMSITGGTNVNGEMNTVYVWDSSMVCLNNCTVTAGSSADVGVQAAMGGRIHMNGSSLTGFPTAALAEHLGEISLYNVSASGNTTGAKVWAGGMILLSGSTPETVGGSANAKAGGFIVKKDGTLL